MTSLTPASSLRRLLLRLANRLPRRSTCRAVHFSDVHLEVAAMLPMRRRPLSEPRLSRWPASQSFRYVTEDTVGLYSAHESLRAHLKSTHIYDGMVRL